MGTWRYMAQGLSAGTVPDYSVLRPGRRPAASASHLPEPLRRPQSGLGGFGVPILRRRRGHQRVEQLPRGSRDVVHGAIEGRLIRLRWLGEPADLPDELERGGTDFFVRRGGREVEQRPDVPAHRVIPRVVESRPTRVRAYAPARRSRRRYSASVNGMTDSRGR